MRQNLLPAVVLLALATGCSKVIIPPAFDLQPHEVIGLVEFRMTNQGQLGQLTTRRFIQAVTEDQPGIRIVELGNETDVLAAVGADRLDPDALKAIGRKYDLRSVFLGEVAVSDIKPRIDIGPGLAFASFRADVDATLSARLVETGSAATIWSGSSADSRTIGEVSKFGSSFSFDARDPETAYGALVSALVYGATNDFRETWRWQRCR
jgi:hypothetical protein